MHSTRHLLFAFGSTALFGVTLGACFTGKQAEGLPCTANSHCGPTLECIDGFCGGVVLCGDGSSVAAELACDGGFDCEDGSDEDPTICGTDAFFCADDTTVPLNATCDQVLDCPDGEDEAAAICVFDQCGATDELFEMFDGPSGKAIDDPLGLFGGNFIGDENDTDLVLAQRGGSFVRILELQPGGAPVETELPGDNGDDNPLPNFVSPVQDVYPYDFDGDGDTDLLVLTTDGKLFVYFSEPPAAPVQLTDGATKYFELPDAVTIVDAGLGRLDVDDPFADSVLLTDEGLVFTITGDPELGAMGMNPFSTEELPMQIDGTAFTQILLADLYGSEVDELLVVGFTEMPQLWIFDRVEGMVLDSWELASQQPIPLAATEFAVGNFDDDSDTDIAFIERMQGRAAILRQSMPGVFMPSVGEMFELGVDISGLAVRDFNCDDIDDLIFNVEAPAALQVVFSNEMAELSAVRSLTFESAGKPQGNLALMKFDPDESWDVFQATGMTSGGGEAEFRSFVSSDPAGAPPP